MPLRLKGAFEHKRLLLSTKCLLPDADRSRHIHTHSRTTTCTPSSCLQTGTSILHNESFTRQCSEEMQCTCLLKAFHFVCSFPSLLLPSYVIIQHLHRTPLNQRHPEKLPIHRHIHIQLLKGKSLIHTHTCAKRETTSSILYLRN